MGWGGGGGEGVRISLGCSSKAVVPRIEEEALSLSVFHYCVCDFPHRCRSFETTLCHLSSIHPFHGVAV